MLKKVLFICSFLFLWQIYAQDTKLAQTYFMNGEYEKAASLYEQIYESNPARVYYFKRLIECKIALDEYESIAHLLETHYKKYPKHHFILVEQAYNLEVQNKEEEAKILYDKAMSYVKNGDRSAYEIARTFYDKHKLDYALEAYATLNAQNPNVNYNFRIATIYGEMGDMEHMFETYFNTLESKRYTLEQIQKYLSKYITDDAYDENNRLFKSLLIKRLQDNPQDDWNKLLAWVFIQEGSYGKAFVQEKAIYQRNKTNLYGLIDIGNVAFEAGDYDTAKQAFSFVKNQTPDRTQQIDATYYLLESEKLSSDDLNQINKSYQQAFNTYGKGPNTLLLQLSYADFLSFYQKNPKQAIDVLEQSLENSLNEFDKARIKIKLADVLVYTGAYNKALIYYSQVQTKLKNHPLAQEARFKVAQTSYFKGDFEWAEIQLKVLKKGTTKLIANDALALEFIIDDNMDRDSTDVALKTYAKADLLTYQHQYRAAIDSLQKVVNLYKGHSIEDEALYKLGQIYTELKDYSKAAEQYQKIEQYTADDILMDDAIFYLAELYDKYLLEPEKAEKYYEKIIMEYPSSIYLVEARKRYRAIRGDELVP